MSSSDISKMFSSDWTAATYVLDMTYGCSSSWLTGAGKMSIRPVNATVDEIIGNKRAKSRNIVMGLPVLFSNVDESEAEFVLRAAVLGYNVCIKRSFGKNQNGIVYSKI